MSAYATAVALFPQIEFPEDPGLPDLPRLFDADRLWRILLDRSDTTARIPRRVRLKHFIHSIGRSALVCYEVDWQKDAYLPADQFVFKVERRGSVEHFRYPQDACLPGLAEAAGAETTLQLVNRHVLNFPARQARVELVRYRPGYRAVLRHKVGKVRLYARVMRPDAISSFLAAQTILGQTRFSLPRLVGHWPKGGVIWLTEISGINLRRYIRRGKMLDPEWLLAGLASLWKASNGGNTQKPFDLARAYRRAKRSFWQKVRDHSAAQRNLVQATQVLDDFVASWQPVVGLAHNDFYDDQLLLMRDGRIALVDYEEIGPGDPLLDVGNFLAHLRWSTCFGNQKEAKASRAYYDWFQGAALERFRWSARELALREAVCLFRVCTNAIRHPKQGWHDMLERGLSLVVETLV